MRKIYWTRMGVPEVVGLSKAEVKLAWAYAFPRVLRHWQVWVGLGVGVVIFVGVFVVLQGVFDEMLRTTVADDSGVQRSLDGVWGSALAGGVAGGLFGLFTAPLVATFGRRYVGEWRASSSG